MSERKVLLLAVVVWLGFLPASRSPLFGAESTLLGVAPAEALSLDEAKAQGLVGETPSGYLEVIKPSPDANSLAAQINAERKKAYEQIAAKNGSPISAVELIAGKQAIDKAPAGTMVKLPNGSWKKK